MLATSTLLWATGYRNRPSRLGQTSMECSLSMSGCYVCKCKGYNIHVWAWRECKNIFVCPVRSTRALHKSCTKNTVSALQTNIFTKESNDPKSLIVYTYLFVSGPIYYSSFPSCTLTYKTACNTFPLLFKNNMHTGTNSYSSFAVLWELPFHWPLNHSWLMPVEVRSEGVPLNQNTKVLVDFANLIAFIAKSTVLLKMAMVLQWYTESSNHFGAQISKSTGLPDSLLQLFSFSSHSSSGHSFLMDNTLAEKECQCHVCKQFRLACSSPGTSSEQTLICSDWAVPWNLLSNLN